MQQPVQYSLSNSTPTTLVFLNDIEIGAADGENYFKSIVPLLNSINLKKWPENTLFAGEAIDKPQAFIVNGDITYHGGGSKLISRGGELREFKKIILQLNAPTYPGLGNHDITYQGDNLSKEVAPNQVYSMIGDYFLGVNVRFGPDESPIVPLKTIDGEARKLLRLAGDNTPVKWQEQSFIYSFDYGFCHLIQLHRYGGDNYCNHATGLHWLMQDLKDRSRNKLVILNQHFEITNLNDTIKDENLEWSNQQRDLLMGLLSAYNITACFHGHKHIPQYSNFLYTHKEEDNIMEPIIDIKVIIVNDEANANGSHGSPVVWPQGYEVHPQDLNQGCVSSIKIYLCFKRRQHAYENPITNFYVKVEGDSGDLSAYEYARDTSSGEIANLNQGTKGKIINLCFRKDGAFPIIKIDFVVGDNDRILPKIGYSFDPADLNKGASGKYIYLSYLVRRDSQIPCFNPGSVGNRPTNRGPKNFLVTNFSSHKESDMLDTVRLTVAYAQVRDNDEVYFRSKAKEMEDVDSYSQSFSTKKLLHYQ